MNVHRFRQVIRLIAVVAVSLGAGAIGSLATIQAIPTWYTTLEKPPLLPPNELFGPVWTVLYILIGIAFFLILQARGVNKLPAYIAWITQLIINTFWSIIFFGFQQPIAALAVIAMLLIAAVWTAREFRMYSNVAAWLFIPYIAWIIFAMYLNLGIALLN